MKRAGSSPEPPVRRRRPRSGLAALLAVPVLATACASGAGGGTATPPASAGTGSASAAAPASGSTVEIDNFMFMPSTLTVPAGTTVTWKFDDSTEHTVSADDNSFTSPPMAGGRTYTHTFTAAGTVAYHCSIHPFMKGTIVVK